MAKSERNQEKYKVNVDAIISNYCSNSKISAAPLWDVEAQRRNHINVIFRKLHTGKKP